MTGPGTGVAPFRANVQERAARSKSGKDVGRTMLFYGFRRRDEDFLYREEWDELAKCFRRSTFSMHVAFSRDDGTKKVHVQHLFEQHAAELRKLILEDGAYVYVCGNAHRMAKDVSKTMAVVVSVDDKFGGNVENAEAYLKNLKAQGRWSEDVW